MNADRWRRIEELYHAARLLKDSARAPFLAAATEGDEALRQEVESLLASGRSSPGFLDAPVQMSGAAARVSDAASLTGRRIGAYAVHERIGAGGMGDVYRAHDSKLRRDVAFKVLAADLIAGNDQQDHLRRFRSEAHALAALNHPNIATLYGLEEAEGVTALVMELVDGPTLADRLLRGAMPLDEALPVATQIADALEAAHERGIVHRDLKPANIKLRLDGTVKVLDFGLAKAVAPAASARDISQHATNTASPVTATGIIVGTAAYMSPEQARGKAVDTRTDIWAFGCVLFEMLTARPVFAGDSLSDVMAGVLQSVPDWSLLDGTPAPVQRLVRRCLEKDVRRRLYAIVDARLEIDDARAGVGDTVVPSQPAVRQVEFQRLTDASGMKEAPTISPDGKMVAFVAVVAGKRQICVRLLSGGTALQLTSDNADHESPRWAPDSNTLIYYTPSEQRDEPGTIWEISALGGWPRRVVSAIGAGDISHDGRRLALFQALDGQPALMVVARNGSQAERVTPLPSGDGYSWARWSPDDRAIAFQRWSGTGFAVHLETVTVATGERRLVCESDWHRGFCWLPDGSGFVYSSSRGSTLLYPPVFNLRTIGRDGRHDRALTFGDQSHIEPDMQRSGTLVVCRIRSQADIWKFPVSRSPADNTRRAVRITRQTGRVQTPTVSPDGTEVAYLTDSGGHGNLWIMRTDGTSPRQVTFERDPATAVGVPSWSPAGDLIVFIRSQRGQTGLATIRPDGSNCRTIVERGWGACWSGDGRWLYYHSPVNRRLEKIPAEGGQAVAVRNDVGATMPAVVKDGSRLFYQLLRRPEILGLWGVETELRHARPEDGPSETIACISGRRLAGVPSVLPNVLSPDDQSIATVLTDGATANIWTIATSSGELKPITDFAGRSTVIARSLSWAADSRHIYAAVEETETDVVSLDGLV
jgi:serine/threonine protein kinase/Tol biopolymer transport system component